MSMIKIYKSPRPKSSRRGHSLLRSLDCGEDSYLGAIIDFLTCFQNVRPYALTSSTRRFMALPSGVSFDATGAKGPTPNAFNRAEEMPYLATRAWTTAAARASDSFMLVSRVPSLPADAFTLLTSIGGREYARLVKGGIDSELNGRVSWMAQKSKFLFPR
jgi:hypothetical protein